LLAKAEEPPETPQETVYADYEKPPVEQYILSEDVSRRTENEKHFLMSDGSYQLSSYQDNVHYKDEEGNWQEIDNSLLYKPTGEPDNTEGYDFYQNKANDFSVKFARKVDSPKHVKVEKDGYEISWKYLREEPEASFWSFLSTAQSPPDVQIENAAKTMTRAAASGDDAFLERSEVYSKATYAKVEEYTDLEYKVLPTGVKENIRVEQKQDDYTYEFELQADGLRYQPTEDGGYIFVNEAGETIFTMPAPYMYDANKELSENVVLQFSQTESGYLFKVIADPAWINDDDRAFPVVIDPVIETIQSKDAIQATFVSSKRPNDNMRNLPYMGVGVDLDLYNKMWSFVKIRLPKLEKNEMVVKSVLSIAQGDSKFDSGVPDNYQMDLYRPNKDWDVSTIKWSNTPEPISPTIVDSQFIKKASGDWATFDITKVVKGWYHGDFPNHGVMIRGTDLTPACGYFHTDLGDVKNAYPIITIQYVNNKGLEDYWSYHTQSLPESGTGSVNDYTGNLVYTQSVAATSGARAPIGMNLVYNSYMANKQASAKGIKVGAGFMLDVNTRIEIITDTALKNNGFHYKWIDLDGTEHYFKKDGDKYIDETGSGYTYRLNYDNNPDFSVIEDKDKNKIVFSQGLFHQRIDANGNRTKLVYSGSIPYWYFDGVDRQLRFTVSTDGYLEKITDHLGRVTTFTYKEGTGGKYLDKIAYPNGTHTHFGYNGSLSLIRSCEDDDGVSNGVCHELGRLTYTYDNTDAYRVTAVTSSGFHGGADDEN
ncbi:MAG: DNRLRE domain-containing protein, partial [Oscillospiraceae bacterium]